jgi:hypothetical protein
MPMKPFSCICSCRDGPGAFFLRGGGAGTGCILQAGRNVHTTPPSLRHSFPLLHTVDRGLRALLYNGCTHAMNAFMLISCCTAKCTLPGCAGARSRPAPCGVRCKRRSLLGPRLDERCFLSAAGRIFDGAAPSYDVECCKQGMSGIQVLMLQNPPPLKGGTCAPGGSVLVR